MTASVLVARFKRRSDLAPIVRAALETDIVYVALDGAPAPGKHVLQLWLDGELVAAVGAEAVGSGRAGEYPLRLRPLDPAHVSELRTLADGTKQSFRAAEPAANSEAQVDDRTLQSCGGPIGGPVPPSRARPPPVELVGAIPTPAAPTTVFDPDALLRSRARKYDADDSVTLPRGERAPDLDAPVDDDSHTLPLGEGSRRGKLASWNVRVATASSDALTGRTVGGGKYRLESVLGSGAMGIVYKASHRDLGRTVAIKVLNPVYRDDADVLQVFHTEARAASQLEHPNIARVYDYGQEPDGLVYIVMEYLSGYTLGTVIGARKRVVPSRAIDVMMQICAGLSAAHDRGIVHRDVKPDNVVLVPAHDDEGRPVELAKVCDFGIAALGTAKKLEDHASGTPEYMAPEQCVGEPATAASDVYACGIVLYETLTGEVPFTGDAPFRILMKHRSEAPRPPSSLVPGIPAALDALVLRALAKSPLARFRNARELRVELRKIEL